MHRSLVPPLALLPLLTACDTADSSGVKLEAIGADLSACIGDLAAWADLRGVNIFELSGTYNCDSCIRSEVLSQFMGRFREPKGIARPW